MSDDISAATVELLVRVKEAGGTRHVFPELGINTVEIPITRLKNFADRVRFEDTQNVETLQFEVVKLENIISDQHAALQWWMDDRRTRLLAKLEEYENTLKWLRDLKLHKEINGKDIEYLRNQPLAWEQVHRVLEKS